MKKHLLALAAVAAMAATPAFAATTVIQTDPITAGKNTYSFSGFNSSLGTLTSVTLTFDVDPTVSGSLKNNANTTKSYTLTEDLTAALKGDGFKLSDTFFSSLDFNNLAGKTTVNFTSLNAPTSNWTALNSQTLTSGLTSFIGTSDVASLIFSSSNPTFSVDPSNSGKYTIGQSGISGDIVLTYNYTPAPPTEPSVAGVPEPATWAMLIMGVAMVGFALRRQRQGQAFAA